VPNFDPAKQRVVVFGKPSMIGFEQYTRFGGRAKIRYVAGLAKRNMLTVTEIVIDSRIASICLCSTVTGSLHSNDTRPNDD
jgi:hypothetical protein